MKKSFKHVAIVMCSIICFSVITYATSVSTSFNTKNIQSDKYSTVGMHKTKYTNGKYGLDGSLSDDCIDLKNGTSCASAGNDRYEGMRANAAQVAEKAKQKFPELHFESMEYFAFPDVWVSNSDMEDTSISPLRTILMDEMCQIDEQGEKIPLVMFRDGSTAYTIRETEDGLQMHTYEILSESKTENTSSADKADEDIDISGPVGEGIEYVSVSSEIR